MKLTRNRSFIAPEDPAVDPVCACTPVSEKRENGTARVVGHQRQHRKRGRTAELGTIVTPPPAPATMVRDWVTAWWLFLLLVGSQAS